MNATIAAPLIGGTLSITGAAIAIIIAVVTGGVLGFIGAVLAAAAKDLNDRLRSQFEPPNEGTPE